MFTESEAIEQWIGNLFEIPNKGQTLLVPEGRIHSRLVSFRVTNKTFSCWRLNPGLVMYPDGYRPMDLNKYEGYDGVVPKVRGWLPVDVTTSLLKRWVEGRGDQKTVLCYGPDVRWKGIAESAGIEHVYEDLSVPDLGRIFNLETGEKRDREVRWPASVQLFLDELTPEDEGKLIDYLVANP